ncbi:PREDICTED: tRNA pseudouridine synthase A, mitochondrial-like [Camelina sativa]|uniref:tRNA pseudouridine synthase A, mitochondrial-like n=1 Tax=Camelina sativa TaxID=90675 RepID=A0ABM0YBB7_CAMSA|nr:PREDICTED: tRNA pseudouridine synthase A, mitochondrial-like [Camelina sativa]
MENQEPEIKKFPEEEAPDREPDQKKLKVSTIGHETDSPVPAAGGSNVAEHRKPKYRRRKVAIVFAFCGVGYQGMQKNPGAKTIEGELEEALFHAGAVPEADRNKPRSYEWARSARTDKGVSAVGQVVSGRFYVDPPGFVERLNSNLPDQIRVFGYKRVAPSFSSKKFCDRRRYVYLIPVFALDPCVHSEAEMVRTDLGYEYVKCVECSEKGYKIPVGVMGKDTDCDSKSLEVQSDISSSNCDALGTDVKCEALSSSVLNGEDKLNSEVLLDGADVSARVMTEEIPDSSSKADDMEESDTLAKGEMNNGEGRVMTESNFCYGEKEKERFNRILSYYVGSHNFHNFTTRIKAADPAANRYILSFNANTVINLDGKDFVTCEVVGQSFMLHQIRKMIGLAVAVMRNYAPESLIETAFKKDVRINVPMAPEVGLYLDECFFTSYNKRFKGSHEEVSMEEYKEVAEEFKWKHVYSHIGSAEEKDGAVAIWLHSLNQRNYPDLRSNEYKPDEVIVYKKIGEASQQKIHEEKMIVKENSNGIVDKVNDGTSEGKIMEERITLEENTTG